MISKKKQQEMAIDVTMMAMKVVHDRGYDSSLMLPENDRGAGG